MKTEMRKKAFEFIDAKRDEMLALWEELVNMESWTSDKKNVDSVAVFLRDRIENFGGQARVVEYADGGNGVVASFGEPTGKAAVCFLGHYDTVFPTGTVAERPFAIKDGKAYGPGALDMKGGLVIQLFVARALKEAGYTDRQIKVLLSGDEEDGHPYTDMDTMIENESRGCVAAFNFETGDVSDNLVVGRKGTFFVDLHITGVSVHAGREPQNGRSAVLELAHKIIDVQALTDFDSGVTFNVGIISGGTAVNAVPDKAVGKVDVRLMRTDQIGFVRESLQAIAAKTYVDGTSTVLEEKIGNIPPMERTAGNEKLFAFVKKTAEKSGQRIADPILSGGGSDSAYTVLAGVPTIDQMGVRGQWNHSDREYALVESLFERAKLAVDCVLDIDSFENE